ncbi:CBS domain-containing protein [Haloferula luteola]|uniref:CBS domain-containing protein n=1 Tax=Haloferula luteola TaxID=595692 RepID=A0A840V5E0_9BACT|nr:DUF294 nucleotidyltransferase-like domain-containing protein [Haloferula luteola]MBB5353235.1 CBS domain-containing protein [Haloferula luteola]
MKPSQPAEPVNRIPLRIAEELRRFPPFSLLNPDVVASLATHATVQVWVKNEAIWRQGVIPEGQLHFLAKGRVEYHWNREGHSELVDVRDVGDLLGLTALAEGVPYQVSAIAADDCLIYSLPWKEVGAEIENADDARNYVRRHLFWLTRVGTAITPATSADGVTTPAGSAGRAKGILQAHLDSAQVVVARNHNLVTCAPSATATEAATLMTHHQLESIVVIDESRHPLGFVHATDLVRHILVDGLPPSTAVEAIMSSPVLAVPEFSSAIAATLLMMQKRVPQLCITEDGTTNSPVLDIWSDRALMKQSGYHPAGLMRDLGHVTTLGRARELSDEIERLAGLYLSAGVSSVVVGQICAELFDELLHRLLQLALAELARGGENYDDVRWAWLSVGSDGRREQILRTDMDNAIVFAGTGDSEHDEALREKLLRLTQRVVAMLVDCGISRCQGGVMASNPRWCRSLDEWLEELQLAELNPAPATMLRAIVLYDMRFVSGDESLVGPLRETIFTRVPKSPGVMRRLAELVVNAQPPLNFSGRFVIERKGRKEEEFDLKGRAIAPLRDAARLWVLKHGLSHHYSTGSRWVDLQNNVPELAELAQLARQSYDELMRMRVLNGLANGDSGRFVDPEKLTKLDRARLSNVFDVIRMVQNQVRTEFGLELRLR